MCVPNSVSTDPREVYRGGQPNVMDVKAEEAAKNAPAPPPPPPPPPAPKLQTPTTVQQPQQKKATGSRVTRRTTAKRNLNTGLSIGGASEGGLNV